MDTSAMGFGVTGALDREIVRALAPQIEAAGFRTLWVNDTPGGDSLESLAVAAEVTTTLQLASGVIPLDRRSPGEIAAKVEALALPQDRLIVGVGSGGARASSALSLVKEGIEALQSRLTSRVMVGALGPRMRRLGAVHSSGVLLNWLTPDAAKSVYAEMVADTEATGVAPSMVDLYIRVALGDAATKRLASEAERYGQIPGYAANFKRLNINGMESSVFGATPAELQAGLRAYAGTVDETVVRAITTNDHQAEYEELLSAIADE
ncbi:MAG: LLM class flavin-dependent oxidoreductase [Thermomicrobiales bacterium]